MIDQNIKVTVCMVTYNQKEFIGKAIESIVKQKTNFKFILLIGDDASTDGTERIVKEYEKKYPDLIKVIAHKINIGAGNNSLSLYKQVNSEYVAICDGDDYWISENKLQLQYDFLQKHSDYSGVFTKTEVIDIYDSSKNHILPNSYCLNKLKEKGYFDTNDLLDYYCILPVSIMWRWKIRDYSSKLLNLQDLIGDIVIGFIHAKYGKIGFIDQVTNCYQRHNSAMWQFQSETLLISIENRIKYLNTYILLKNFYDNKNSLGFDRNINIIYNDCLNNAVKVRNKSKIIELVVKYYDLFCIQQTANYHKLLEYDRKYKNIDSLINNDLLINKNLRNNRRLIRKCFYLLSIVCLLILAVLSINIYEFL